MKQLSSPLPVDSALSDIVTKDISDLPLRKLEPGECQTLQKKRCTLCHASRVNYDDETRRKEHSLRTWWNTVSIECPIDSIVHSPRGRRYRTVSKRKAFLVNRRFSLGLIGVDDETSKNFPLTVNDCVIEPADHGAVYRVLQEYLQRKEHLSLAEEFNYVIVKGDTTGIAVILNMNHFSSANRKEVNHLSKFLTAHVPSIRGVFVFIDEERSRYYLSDRRRSSDGKRKPVQKIFGLDKLMHTVGTEKFLYSPLSFSQTNHSILESFVTTVKSLLALENTDHLTDLYCGYGLFSLSCAGSADRVTGIELSRSSISDAIENAKRNKISNCRFYAENITFESLKKHFITRLTSRTNGTTAKFILDPPRNGTADGVIELLASQRPSRVIHIFCNPDIITKELLRWKKSGYIPDKVVPFDMFPGTNEIEIVVSLKHNGSYRDF